jgi:predicted amidophosphoribosyltransferase
MASRPLRFKFHHYLAAGGLLSQLMAQALASAPRPDALISIPLHRARLRQRGYDQALELARPLARDLGLPLLSGALALEMLGQSLAPANSTPRSDGATSRTRSRCRPASVFRRTWRSSTMS